MLYPQSRNAVFTPKSIASAIALAFGATSISPVATAESAVESGALTIDAVRIDAERMKSAYKTDESASEKYTAPLRETPKSVTVINRQVMQDTQATSLVDALRTTPGITFGAGEGGNPQADRPIIRGFNAESDVFVDGMRDIAAQTREVFNVESIEVSKGPGSAFTGAGSTGGSLNLITKTAHLGDAYEGGLTLGSDQTRRYTLDLNTQLADSASFRLNLLKHQANVAGRDNVHNDRWGIAPSLALGLGTDTRVILDYYHLEVDDMPDYGIPLVHSGKARGKHHVDRPMRVDPSNFYGLTHRDYRRSRNDSGTLRIEHDLNEHLTLSNSLRLSRSTLDYIVSNPDDSRGNVANGLVYRSAKSRNSTSSGFVNQTDLQARFDTGSIQHSVVSGFELSHQDTHNRPYLVRAGAPGRTCNAALLASGDCTRLHSPSPKDAWHGTISDSPAYTDTNVRARAAYLFDTLTFNERWSLNLGLRYDEYDVRSSGYATAGRTTPVAGTFSRGNVNRLWNHQVGVTYNVAPNGSVYAAWSTSSNPAGESAGNGGSEISAANMFLEPEKSHSYEVGSKWDLFGDNLALTAALFRTDKTNARVPSADDYLVQVLEGRQRVQGVELTYSGNLTSQLKVFGGYTYLHSEIVETTVASQIGNRMPSTPRDSFSLWTTYELMPKLTVGGGAMFMGSRFGNADNSVEIPSYWRYDLMASYALTRQLDLRLNVQNLTDKRYYDQVFQTHYARVASGRTASLSANLRF